MFPTLFIALCVVFRIIPHPPNFAPAGAVAVFAGRTLRPRSAFALVILAMLIGDLALSHLHGYPALSAVTPFVYGGYLVQTGLGRRFRGAKGGAVLAALSGSLAFFLLSNLGVWLVAGIYPHTAAGLGACFVAALPFLASSAAGDLVWTLLLTGAYRPLAERWKGHPAWVPVPAAGRSAI